MNKTIRSRPRVKPVRRTPKVDAPFGQGVAPRYTAEFSRVDHTLEDERWLAEETLRDEPLDEEWDILAAERDAEDRWLASVGAGLTCSVCGLKPEPGDSLQGGYCDRCAPICDTGWDLESQDSCIACGAPIDGDGELSLCNRCEDRATDASTRCQTGLTLVY
jgi:hypothetical protein